MLITLLLLSVQQIVYGYPINDTNACGKNDTYARQAEAPWTTLLVIRGNRCTGSLVNKKYVVTAAHCFDVLEDYKSLKDEMKIYFGEWKTDRDPDCNLKEELEEDCDSSDDSVETVCYPDHAADISPKNFIIHPEYLRNRGSQYKNAYDIAVIELMRPPRETKITQSIKLPDSETCEDDLGESVLVTGFGEIRPKVYTTIKKRIEITLKTPSECKRSLGIRFDIDKHFCGIGPNDRATCKGDSGGPAVYKVNGKYILQGIVSFGSPECGYGNTPSAFLKVACFTSWIESKIGVAIDKTTRSRSTTTKEPFQSSDESNE